MPMLSANNITKSFGGIKAVDSCSIAVECGSITGLIGPNGSGKTTLFNIITGFYKLDDGTVLLADKPIQGLKPNQIYHRGIGRTFQITRLFWKMTVLENMIVPVKQLGLRTLMSQGVNHEARKLSFGQQKLVELAAVLMSDPAMILLDEPAGGVNPVMIEKMMELVEDLNQKGTTFLLVEHNMRLVMELCQHIVVLDHGQKIAEGGPSEIQNNPLVLEAYLGSTQNANATT
jgi:neutral amino acid transport system ATP-binding protein